MVLTSCHVIVNLEIMGPLIKTLLLLAWICFVGVLGANAGDVHPTEIIARDSRTVLPGGDWEPTAAQCDQVLESVRAFLTSTRAAGGAGGLYAGRILDMMGSYRVQFRGVMREGRRMIWCNFFPLSDGHPTWKWMDVVVLDGGTSYWQIYCNPDTGECLDLVHSGDCC